jgi:restriction endonuclease
LKGRLGANAIKNGKETSTIILSMILIMSGNFAETVGSRKKKFAVYVKLPERFFISIHRSVNYNPDWAIAFHGRLSKAHLFLWQRRRAILSSMQLRKSRKPED